MPTPINSQLYHHVKMLSDRKFGPKTSLYKSSWMVHTYVKMGGKYHGQRDSHHGIINAFEKLKSSSKKQKTQKKSKRQSKQK
jgi:hypothetical protein